MAAAIQAGLAPARRRRPIRHNVVAPRGPMSFCVRCCKLWVGSAAVLFGIWLVGSLMHDSASPDSKAVDMYATVDAPPPSPVTLGVNQTVGLRALQMLCDKFDQGVVSGDLCNRLCYYRREWVVSDVHHSTKLVVTVDLGGQKTVLKTAAVSIDDFEPPPLGLTQKQFEHKIVSSVNSVLHLGWRPAHSTHLLSLLWPAAQRAAGGTLAPSDRRSMWALIQQDEYVLFSVLPMARIFPKVLGSCGHFYSVEPLVAFRMKPQYHRLRAKILVHLMGTLKLLDEFLNEPLQWCDVRFDSFGLSADYPKRFVILDGDMVLPLSRANAALRATRCSGDAHCNLGDCAAKCDQVSVPDPARGLCSDRVNSNLEVFCAKLVGTLFPPSTAPLYKNNRYISACYDTGDMGERMKSLHVALAWNLPDV